MLLVRFKTTNRTRCFNFSIRESNDLKLYDDIIIKIMRELIKDFFSKMKGKIREDKFIDKKYPRITIEK